jgi:hypothetical protein
MKMTTKTRQKQEPKLSPTAVAKMRRAGATWAEVSEAAGQVKTSTGWAHYIAGAGFERDGVKPGSKQTSKARAHGPSFLNGDSPKKKGAKAK